MLNVTSLLFFLEACIKYHFNQWFYPAQMCVVIQKIEDNLCLLIFNHRKHGEGTENTGANGGFRLMEPNSLAKANKKNDWFRTLQSLNFNVIPINSFTHKLKTKQYFFS